MCYEKKRDMQIVRNSYEKLVSNSPKQSFVVSDTYGYYNAITTNDFLSVFHFKRVAVLHHFHDITSSVWNKTGDEILPMPLCSEGLCHPMCRLASICHANQYAKFEM